MSLNASGYGPVTDAQEPPDGPAVGDHFYKWPSSELMIYAADQSPSYTLTWRSVVPPVAEPYRVEVIATGDPFVVRVSGDIDRSAAPRLISLAEHPDNSHERVVLDIGAVTHLDTEGVRAIEELANRSLSLELRDVSPPVMAELHAAGLDNRVLVVLGP